MSKDKDKDNEGQKKAIDLNDDERLIDLYSSSFGKHADGGRYYPTNDPTSEHKPDRGSDGRKTDDGKK